MWPLARPRVRSGCQRQAIRDSSRDRLPSVLTAGRGYARAKWMCTCVLQYMHVQNHKRNLCFKNKPNWSYRLLRHYFNNSEDVSSRSRVNYTLHTWSINGQLGLARRRIHACCRLRCPTNFFIPLFNNAACFTQVQSTVIYICLCSYEGSVAVKPSCEASLSKVTPKIQLDLRLWGSLGILRHTLRALVGRWLMYIFTALCGIITNAAR